MIGRDGKEDEARRALKRLDAQSEKLFGAQQAEEGKDDAIEKLGKRIGRVLSYLLAAGLIYYLWMLI